jgi:hypothetical protein
MAFMQIKIYCVNAVADAEVKKCLRGERQVTDFQLKVKHGWACLVVFFFCCGF